MLWSVITVKLSYLSSPLNAAMALSLTDNGLEEPTELVKVFKPLCCFNVEGCAGLDALALSLF